jgi:alpha-tubulin suppressor-like RCC1 family protein
MLRSLVVVLSAASLFAPGCSLIANSSSFRFDDAGVSDGSPLDGDPLDAGTDAGDGAISDVPTDAPPATIVAIAPGFTHSCAVLDDGRLRCWGSNASGQLGEGPDRDAPETETVRFEGADHLVSDIAVSDGTTCVVTARGRVLCRGDNTLGQLGAESARGNNTDWVEVVDASGPIGDALFIESSAVGTYCAARAASLACWGSNRLFAEAGVADGGDLRSANTILTMPVTEVVLRRATGCALTEAGTVYCWGSDEGGTRGDGDVVTSSLSMQAGPTEVPGISGAQTLGLMAASACVVRGSGALTCWGQGAVLIASNAPIDVPLPAPITGTPIGVSGLGAVVWLETDSGVYSWGRNDDGILGGGEALGAYAATPAPTRDVHAPARDRRGRRGMHARGTLLWPRRARGRRTAALAPPRTRSGPPRRGGRYHDARDRRVGPPRRVRRHRVCRPPQRCERERVVRR